MIIEHIWNWHSLQFQINNFWPQINLKERNLWVAYYFMAFMLYEWEVYLFTIIPLSLLQSEELTWENMTQHIFKWKIPYSFH